MRRPLASLLSAIALVTAPACAGAHGVSAEDARFMDGGGGWFDTLQVGARHMLSGVDHLLFLLAVVLMLRRPLQVLLYVSLFSLGHSIGLLAGAAVPWQADASLVDAVIAVSVAWKAFDNLHGFDRAFGAAPDPRWLVPAFGLVHGLGLATSLRSLPSAQGASWGHLVAFNGGVELGQLIALVPILGVLLVWRRRAGFERASRWINGALVCAGLALCGGQWARFESPPTPAAEDLTQAATQAYHAEVIEIPLAAAGQPGDEREWTMQMRRGQHVVYAWRTTAPADEFYSDFHGAATATPARPAAAVPSYHVGMGNSAQGTLAAPVDGIHGWYLQNQSDRPVVVTLQLAGFYTRRADPYAPD